MVSYFLPPRPKASLPDWQMYAIDDIWQGMHEKRPYACSLWLLVYGTSRLKPPKKVTQATGAAPSARLNAWSQLPTKASASVPKPSGQSWPSRMRYTRSD